MISWTRLLGGDLRDAVVGGHILLGVTAGIVSAGVIRMADVVGRAEFLRVPSTGAAVLVGDSLTSCSTRWT